MAITVNDATPVGRAVARRKAGLGMLLVGLFAATFFARKRVAN